MNATIGKYIPNNTLMHRMNPIIKLISNIIFIILIFIAQSFIIIGGILLISIIVFLMSQLRKRQLIKIFFTILIIGIFLFIVNIFVIQDSYKTDSTTGRVDYTGYSNQKLDGFFFYGVQTWKIRITDRSVFQCLFVMMRIYIMIVFTTVLTATTKPKALTKSLEQLMWPLKIFFVPVHIIAMIISIALRFIPTLLEEAQRIMKAQASRGVDFKNGNIKTKAKAMITLIIPLFVSSFSKADDLGNAMETRGYDPYEKRTSYRKYPFTLKDYIATIFIIGLLVFVIITHTNIFPNKSWWV